VTLSHKFRISTFNVLFDSLAVELNKRMEAYSSVHELFSFLMQFRSMTHDDVKKCAFKLVTTYPAEIEESSVNFCSSRL